MTSRFQLALADHQSALNQIASLEPELTRLAQACILSLRAGGKILFCGNGGSSCDADHLAAELVGRFQLDRKGWAAISLATSMAGLTAIANDYGFEAVFERQVEALGRSGDVLIAISTSGKSPNVLRAANLAKEMGIHVSAWTGQNPSPLSELAETKILAPSSVTARVQEMHILLGHILCDLIETELTAT